MSFESQISNFYEKLVADEFDRRQESLQLSEDQQIDIACVALNQLPSRYYRFSVDMAFYLEAADYREMEKAVKEAVDYAIEFVKTHKSRVAE
ncbi:late competence development ComFB family protein [Reinekea marinisedimentorum]|uniref:Late competence development protein ComFB n=1 Tax=Reinekea marinisedimentorum TaxID=230495 RepID=A0A4R3HZC3_9GAMM|nr:late competence development ComFB family protein [Reinekea marinisedimentorum]TCS38234.1 late competence development protein ComFB [Reinekea marinisedimentorum]